VQIVGTNVVVTIVAVPSDTYQLQFSASMVPASWTNVVGAVTNNATGAVPLIDVGGASHPQRFYRVEVVP
jgi:hypothetical protein